MEILRSLGCNKYNCRFNTRRLSYSDSRTLDFTMLYPLYYNLYVDNQADPKGVTGLNGSALTQFIGAYNNSSVSVIVIHNSHNFLLTWSSHFMSEISSTQLCFSFVQVIQM